VMDSKDMAVKRAINVRAVDGCLIGQNTDGTIILPIRYMETEPDGTIPGLVFIKEPSE